MLSMVAHYKNKYPGGDVHASENQLRAYCASRKLRVVLEKDGQGMWVDASERYGACDKHDMSPIPKDARAWKHYPREHGGPGQPARPERVAPAEEHEDRTPKAYEYASQFEGRVPSEKEMAQAKK